MAEIINNIAGILYWDILLMGLFTLLLLIAGAIWMSSSSRGFIRKANKVTKWLESLGKKEAGTACLLALIAIYYAGVMANTLSDDWIDKRNPYHLYLKKTWLKSKYDTKYGSDDAIKICTYERVYGDKQRDRGDIIDFYYFAKNKLWKDESWRKYILYSQTMINISRVWCLTFLLLLPLALTRFVIHLVKDILNRIKCPSYSEVLLSLLVVAIALIGYWTGGIVWQSSEEEIDSKIFGVYRSEFGVPPRIVEQIERSRVDHELTELVTPRLLEASGVVAFDNHLLVVNDKDNFLYVFSLEDPSRRLTVIEVPEFRDEKAKFEDISFHRASGYFYVIGAHYSTVPAYQKAFRFKLEKDGESWSPRQIEELPISVEILRYLSGKESVEGLAVAGTAKAPILFVGIRSDKPGRSLILEFFWEQSEFVLRFSHELSLSPLYSSGVYFRPMETWPHKVKEEVAYHLSGLAAVSESELGVLAASEDEANGFHGNRVYTLDLRNWVQNSVTPEFAVAQKAEGIAFWKTSKTERRFSIVFDNDQQETGQPSRLLIANSLNALRK